MLEILHNIFNLILKYVCDVENIDNSLIIIL
jgi:hypothetical protein